MIAVIFEVWPAEGERQHYLDLAAALRSDLEGADGFISVERFQSLTDPGGVFADYRLRVAGVLRDYGMAERAEAPDDSRAAHRA